MIQWRWMCSEGFSCCWSQLTMVQALWPGKCLATFCCSWSKRERQTIKCPPQSIPNRQPRHRNLFLLPISLFIGFDTGWFTYIITKNHPPPNRFWRFSLLEKILNIALRILSVKGKSGTTQCPATRHCFQYPSHPNSFLKVVWYQVKYWVIRKFIVITVFWVHPIFRMTQNIWYTRTWLGVWVIREYLVLKSNEYFLLSIARIILHACIVH